MKIKIFLIITLLFFLASCGGKEKDAQSVGSQVSGEALSGVSLDAIDIAIVMYAQRSAFNRVTVSDKIKQLISRYGEGTSFEISVKGITQPFLKSGSKIIIPPGGEFICSYKGKLNFTVKFTEGEVGIIDSNIFVKDGTRSQIDSDSYIFHSGKWRKIK